MKLNNNAYSLNGRFSMEWLIVHCTIVCVQTAPTAAQLMLDCNVFSYTWLPEVRHFVALTITTATANANKKDKHRTNSFTLCWWDFSSVVVQRDCVYCTSDLVQLMSDKAEREKKITLHTKWMRQCEHWTLNTIELWERSIFIIPVAKAGLFSSSNEENMIRKMFD